ncbi:2-hydroxychromene-2-carboxylate isomerase [Ruegeria sp. HKCCD7559]|uniref:2-hydroxychromene-2-carboxylate isomerase n=1 Tax=Ruegeria sp. HKCCD7559 TaxID=2683005 RepID=UPI001490C988|nr:2-hydroxychromene-2-carboxylate isomerase [Ruegeria sp. HKCCD7559]NOC46190.1 2-hydroxychromene-2-carboxylate isomerase [Ruegeria sp. HKCCD7559]
MAKTIQFWFEFASTYSYLSAMRIEAAAQDKGVAIEWHSFLLGPIFAEQGWRTSPFNLYPAKGRYMWRDMERLCKARGLPFAKPDPFPQNSLRAARLALAIEDHRERAAFVRAVFSAEFGAGQNISEDSVLASCLDEAGVHSSVMNRAGDTDIKQALFEQSARAKALGLFGAPSFLAGEELFWGDDRLDDALEYSSTI